MKVEDLKWYSPFLSIVGTILSFADPITDILTLVEFYRADQKTWFGVGLVFVILPCLAFLTLYLLFWTEDISTYSGNKRYMEAILCGFHPFSAAFARIKGFVLIISRGDDETDLRRISTDYVLQHIDNAVLFEAVLESAPQFIIQLYAVSVQEEPVQIIQIISLPVSFLSIAWAFTTTDEFIIIRKLGYKEDRYALKINEKLFLFTTHLFFLSSRLFAVCYFTVSYIWWVIGVLVIHTVVIAIFDNIWNRSEGNLGELNRGVKSVLCCCIYWLRDDISVLFFIHDELTPRTMGWRKMQMLSNVLIVTENFVFILLFYFSQHSNTWYSLPVTVCVCVFSFLGSVMRVIIFRVLLKGNQIDADNSSVNNNENQIDAVNSSVNNTSFIIWQLLALTA